MKKNTKGAKGNQDFLKSNVETGAHNWNWAPNYGSSRMNQQEISNYKKQQLANAKKVGGGILNTNVETGNWHGMQFIVPEKSDRIGPNDLEAQEKFFAGQLKETITGPIPGQKGPKGQNAPVKFNNNGGWGQSGYGQDYGNSRDDRYQFVEKNLIIIISMKKDFNLHNKEITICNIIKIMNRDIIQKVMNKAINKKILNQALITIMRNQILIN